MIRQKKNNGITLIALVITIIVLLILAGISIAMLTGNNSILTQAGNAKDISGDSQITEKAKIAYAGALANGSGKVTEELFKTELDKEFGTNGYELNTDEETGEWVVEVDNKERFRVKSSGGSTLGEKYQDSWIGKTINYVSENNNGTIQGAGGWIILGKQTSNGKNDILITTANPVGSLEIRYFLEEWLAYETKLHNSCKTYVGQTGKLGTKDTIVKEVRSITLEDINKAVGFSETINPITISNDNGGYAYPNEDGTGWVLRSNANYLSYTFPTEAYGYHYDNGYKMYSNSGGTVSVTLGKPDNMKYVLAHNGGYFAASRSVEVRSGKAWYCIAEISQTNVECKCNFLTTNSYGSPDEDGSNNTFTSRPVVVLSAEIPYADATIGDYFTY